MVNVSGHFFGAARSPSPDGWRHIVNGANIAGLFDPFRHAQAKIRAVDGDLYIRPHLKDRIGNFSNAAFEVDVFGQHLGKAHHRQLVHRKLRG